MMDWKMYGQIQEHKKQDFKKSQTARMLDKDYKTVSKYWDMSPNEFSTERESAGNRLRKAERYEDYVVETLRDFPDMSAAQLYDWILEKTLAYCMQRNLYSAGDFKSTLLYLNQLPTDPNYAPQWEAMAALPDKYKGMIPAIRNLNDYEKAMKGSGAID